MRGRLILTPTISRLIISHSSNQQLVIDTKLPVAPGLATGANFAKWRLSPLFSSSARSKFAILRHNRSKFVAGPGPVGIFHVFLHRQADSPRRVLLANESASAILQYLSFTMNIQAGILESDLTRVLLKHNSSNSMASSSSLNDGSYNVPGSQGSWRQNPTASE